MSILVVGSLHLDVVLRAPRMPALDETVAGRSVNYVFGGKGGNQAVAAARHGADVSSAGRTAAVQYVSILKARLQETHIRLDLLQQDPGPSGMSAAIIDENGDYGAVIVSAANLNIDPDAISIPVGTQLVLLQNEIPEPVNESVAHKAKQAGARVWLNAAPARFFVTGLLENVDLLILNRLEAKTYDATEGPDRMVTLGADGVHYQGAHHDGFAVQILSTHGAGDMFIGALAARTLETNSIERSLRYAQAAAALHVSTDIGYRHCITPGKVQAFLKDQARR